MNRRVFITLLGGAAAWPLAARAQQSERTHRVGVLMPYPNGNAEARARLAAFSGELQKLGRIDGSNLRIEVRWTTANAEGIRAAAASLVALAPDVLLATALPSVMALQHATRSIPIVFVQVRDPLAAGIVESLAHPGGKCYRIYDG